MRRALALLVLIAIVAAACGEADGVSLQADDATTTPTSSTQTASGPTTTSASGSSTSTTIDDGNPPTESTPTGDSTTTTTDTGRAPATVPNTTIPPITGEGPTSLVDAIVADAAGRAGVSAGEVTVVRSEAVVWNDGSLGCPEPGGAYTQALVDGYWVVVAAAERESDYRATATGSFKLCARPSSGGTVVDR